MSISYELITPQNGDSWIRMTSNGVVSCVPMDEANTDYRQYLEWLADGNEPEVIEG